MHVPTSPGSRSAPRADERTVRELLREQVPELADRRLAPGPTGWDNTHWLLGDDLAVRLPRRRSAVGLVANEVRWLPVLADALPLAVPTPVHAGAPSGEWSWPWSIIPWFPGERSDLAHPPPDPEQHAVALGRFLAALHVPAPDDAPHNPYRSIQLRERAPRTEEAIDALATRRDDHATRPDDHHVDGDVRGTVEVLGAAWRLGVEAALHPGPRTWIHGDLHPGNQLVADGVLHAVVDWGDVAAGDPAADLATAWWSLPVTTHAAFRGAYGGVDDAAWARGIGWAAAIALYVLKEGPAVNDPALVSIARRTVARLRTAV